MYFITFIEKSTQKMVKFNICEEHKIDLFKLWKTNPLDFCAVLNKTKILNLIKNCFKQERAVKYSTQKNL